MERSEIIAWRRGRRTALIEARTALSSREHGAASAEIYKGLTRLFALLALPGRRLLAVPARIQRPRLSRMAHRPAPRGRAPGGGRQRHAARVPELDARHGTGLGRLRHSLSGERRAGEAVDSPHPDGRVR